MKFIGLAVVPLIVVACNKGVDHARPAAESQESSAPPRAGATGFTLADFQALRYLEGDWRGSGYAGGPFYETYRFLNDSTIEMTAWTDSTMTTARERSQYMLRDGVVRTTDNARLTRVDAEGHHFQAKSYAWTFRRVAADRWTARVGPSTIYTMDRLTRR